MQLTELAAYLNQLLQIDKIPDYCPNGLQVEGQPTIKKIITGVSANQALIAQAHAVKADAILVHHGFFWKGEEACITGIKYNRLAGLIKNDISLLAYHLPLDLHPEYGNNAQLAKQLELLTLDYFDVGNGLKLGCVGKLMQPCSGEAFAEKIAYKLQRPPLHIAASAKPIQRVAWCTGAAQDLILPALNYNIDAFVTGEISERTVHIAQEANIHFFAAGHHATERYGVQALGEHVAKEFGIEHLFIDIDNPV